MGHLNVVRILVEDLGADINRPSNDGTTPLLAAARRMHLAVVLYLIKAHVNATVNVVKMHAHGLIQLIASTLWFKISKAIENWTAIVTGMVLAFTCWTLRRQQRYEAAEVLKRAKDLATLLALKREKRAKAAEAVRKQHAEELEKQHDEAKKQQYQAAANFRLQLQAALERLPDSAELECKICLSCETEWWAFGCGHVVCAKCAKTLNHARGLCPFCRKPIKSQTPVYF
jgi:hypothetical protein